MFGYSDASRPPGSRRLGGPVQFKDLWPTLREELHEAYVAHGGLGHLDSEPAPDEMETVSSSFSRAA